MIYNILKHFLIINTISIITVINILLLLKQKQNVCVDVKPVQKDSCKESHHLGFYQPRFWLLFTVTARSVF